MKEMLKRLADHSFGHSVSLACHAIGTFLRLMATGEDVMPLAPTLLAGLGRIGLYPFGFMWLHFAGSNAFLVGMRELAEFAKHHDPAVQEGALILWEAFINCHENQELWIMIAPVIRFDAQYGLSLLENPDPLKRRQGIALLTLTDLRISDIGSRTRMLGAMTAASGDEIVAWAGFLGRIPIKESDVPAWQESLELIIGSPMNYPQAIVKEAKQRYALIASETETDIVGNESKLDLPSVGTEKSARAGRLLFGPKAYVGLDLGTLFD